MKELMINILKSVGRHCFGLRSRRRDGQLFHLKFTDQADSTHKDSTVRDKNMSEIGLWLRITARKSRNLLSGN